MHRRLLYAQFAYMHKWSITFNKLLVCTLVITSYKSARVLFFLCVCHSNTIVFHDSYLPPDKCLFADD
jgi:hypothetical protein